MLDVDDIDNQHQPQRMLAKDCPMADIQHQAREPGNGDAYARGQCHCPVNQHQRYPVRPELDHPFGQRHDRQHEGEGRALGDDAIEAEGAVGRQVEDHESGGDQIYFQGHASPGIYARAFIEGRLGQDKLENFRRELRPGGGLSSYPHPWLMPSFWSYPTVSMGLGPLMAIYQARFMKYLQHRGLAKTDKRRVWAFCGDGEMGERECMGAIWLGAIGLGRRESLRRTRSRRDATAPRSVP